ncbi:MAG TPA: AMP-binding protein [Acidobacteriota bacterium]|jgi:acyl-CoA synthetase (AMP-forming)/AMP-acid ligase II|nr:AMP-binding protein [Acidobacteriota bacterium]
MKPLSAASTLTSALRERLAETPETPACTLIFLEKPEESYSLSQFLTRCSDYARHLQSVDSTQEQLVCICLYHGLDLLAAFVGSFLAGQIPTMIAPPSPRMEKEKYTSSFTKIVEHLHPRFFITDRATLGGLASLSAEGPAGCELIYQEDVSPSQARSPESSWVSPAPESTVLIQHSSGTTGLQKGVALSHRAVLTQVHHYASILDLSAQDKIVSWLPLYHDMGLIACFLLPLLCRVPFVQLSPFDWVLRPGMLFDAIHRHQGTLCFLPNFAYEYLRSSVRHSQMSGISIASVRGLINCSEPVRAETHRRFAQTFGAAGVTPEKLWSCYAMAENVFAVTQSSVEDQMKVDVVRRAAFTEKHLALPADANGDEQRFEFVSCGPPIPGTCIEIRDDIGNRCDERSVGEICIQGDSLFSGYYRRDDLTEAAFTGDRWYKTGDFGYLAGGELYVTGRKKDLIIVQGRNFYPSDIEAIVSETSGVVPGRVVAFGLFEERLGTESIVVLAETPATALDELEQISSTIRNEVAQQLDCTLGSVYLLPPKWLVKSTAGKIARADNKRKFLRELRPGGTLQAHGRAP